MNQNLRLLASAVALLLSPLPALAASSPDTGQGIDAVTGIDVMTSTVMQKGQSSISGLGLRVRIQSPRVIKEIEFMPSIEYWRSYTTAQPYDIRATRKDATLGTDVRYNFQSGAWKPYLGAGMAIHFLSTRVDAPSFGVNDDTNSVIKGGLAVLGGVSFGLAGKLDNFLEIKYHHLSDYRQLKFNWGLAYNL